MVGKTIVDILKLELDLNKFYFFSLGYIRDKIISLYGMDNEKTNIRKGFIFMKLFKKTKKTRIEIVTDVESNLKVQEFVNKHCAEHSTIDVCVNGSQYDNSDRLVSVEFVTTETRDDIVQELKKDFRYYNLDFKRILIFLKETES